MFSRINKILGITSIALGFITYASLFVKGIIEEPNMLHLLFFIGAYYLFLAILLFVIFRRVYYHFKDKLK